MGGCSRQGKKWCYFKLSLWYFHPSMLQTFHKDPKEPHQRVVKWAHDGSSLIKLWIVWIVLPDFRVAAYLVWRRHKNKEKESIRLLSNNYTWKTQTISEKERNHIDIKNMIELLHVEDWDFWLIPSSIALQINGVERLKCPITVSHCVTCQTIIARLIHPMSL